MKRKEKHTHTGASHRSTVLYFARLNIITRPGRSLLFTFFFLMVAASSFVMMAELYANADDALTKNYSQDGYPYADETRLDVRHSDGSAFTDEEIEEIRALSYVDCVDPWDISNDFNYYMHKGEDYSIIYGYQTESRSTTEITSPNFLEDDKFVRSSDCITEADLAEGELPSELTEIVLYSKDSSQLGRTIRVYLRSSTIWGSNEWCYYDMTVVGLLAEKTEQVYFSPLLCHMLSVSAETTVYLNGTQDHIPLIGVGLAGSNMLISFKYPVEWDAALSGYLEFYVPVLNRTKGVVGQQIQELGEGYSVYVANPYHDKSNGYAQKPLTMSEEFFLELFPMETTELAVYLTSYGHTDKALRKLESMGYEAVSTWRVSVDGYDRQLVRERFTVIGICSLCLLLLFVLGALIIRGLHGIRFQDVILLRRLGMRKRMTAEIGAVENACFGIVGMLLGLAAVGVLWQADAFSLRELFGYVDWYTYVAYAGYNGLLCAVTVLCHVWRSYHMNVSPSG